MAGQGWGPQQEAWAPLSGCHGVCSWDPAGLLCGWEESPASAPGSERVGLDIRGIGVGSQPPRDLSPTSPVFDVLCLSLMGLVFFLHLEAVIFLPKCFKSCIRRNIFKITGNFINCVCAFC